jgi:hypothetical protein
VVEDFADRMRRKSHSIRTDVLVAGRIPPSAEPKDVPTLMGAESPAMLSALEKPKWFHPEDHYPSKAGTSGAWGRPLTHRLTVCSTV